MVNLGNSQDASWQSVPVISVTAEAKSPWRAAPDTPCSPTPGPLQYCSIPQKSLLLFLPWENMGLRFIS